MSGYRRSNEYSLRAETSDRLRAARKRAGFKTAAEFAKAIGVSEVTYRAQERGSRGLTSEFAKLYSEHLSVSLDWLISGNPEGAPEFDQSDRPVVPNARRTEVPWMSVIEIEEHFDSVQGLYARPKISPYFRFIKAPIAWNVLGDSFNRKLQASRPFLVHSRSTDFWNRTGIFESSSVDDQSRVFLARPLIRQKPGRRILLVRPIGWERETAPVILADAFAPSTSMSSNFKPRYYLSSGASARIGDLHLLAAEDEVYPEVITVNAWARDLIAKNGAGQLSLEGLVDLVVQSKETFLDTFERRPEPEEAEILDEIFGLKNDREGKSAFVTHSPEERLLALVGIYELTPGDHALGLGGGAFDLIEMTEILPEHYLTLSR